MKRMSVQLTVKTVLKLKMEVVNFQLETGQRLTLREAADALVSHGLASGDPFSFLLEKGANAPFKREVPNA